MFKIHTIFCVCIGIAAALSCHNNQQQYKIDAETVKDAASERIIDSFNTIINKNCELAVLNEAPALAQKIVSGDTAAVFNYFSQKHRYADTVEKVQKVITALQNECDSNLLKETYRIVQQLQTPIQK